MSARIAFIGYGEAGQAMAEGVGDVREALPRTGVGVGETCQLDRGVDILLLDRGLVRGDGLGGRRFDDGTVLGGDGHRQRPARLRPHGWRVLVRAREQHWHRDECERQTGS